MSVLVIHPAIKLLDFSSLAIHRPSVHQWLKSMSRHNFFSLDFKNAWYIWVNWVKIVDGAEYQHHNSLHMCRMDDNVAWAFWGFLKSILNQSLQNWHLKILRGISADRSPVFFLRNSKIWKDFFLRISSLCMVLAHHRSMFRDYFQFFASNFKTLIYFLIVF